MCNLYCITLTQTIRTLPLCNHGPGRGERDRMKHNDYMRSLLRLAQENLLYLSLPSQVKLYIYIYMHIYIYIYITHIHLHFELISPKQHICVFRDVVFRDVGCNTHCFKTTHTYQL